MFTLIVESADAPNPGMAVPFQFDHQWRGVADADRWKKADAMKHFTSLIAWSLVVLAFVFTASPRAEAQSTNAGFTLVTVKDRKGETVCVSLLERKARDYLYQKAPETRTNANLGVSVLVDCSPKQASYCFTYCGKPGEDEYSVTCDSQGRVKEYRVQEYEAGMRYLPPKLIKK